MFVGSVIASKDDGYLRATGGTESMPLQIQLSVLNVENGAVRSINRNICGQPQVAADECVACKIRRPSQGFCPRPGGATRPRATVLRFLRVCIRAFGAQVVWNVARENSVGIGDWRSVRMLSDAA